MDHPHPRSSFQSPRFAQPATFMRLPHREDLTGVDVAIVGVPYDGGTSYRVGSRHGPRAIRDQSSLIRTYVSFDIDAVDPAFAPGTGTPEVGGLTSHDAQRLVRGLGGLPIVGCDLVEVSPSFDGPGQITALLAANLLFELLCVMAKGPGPSERPGGEADRDK